jgi:adenosylhomocysteine nucleosidase
LIGVFAALPAEAACLAGRRYAAGVIVQPAPNLVLIAGGIGANAATRGAEQLLATGATALCSWGCAAGLAADLQAGDVFIPEVILGTSGESHATDTAWRDQLLAALASTRLSIHAGALTDCPGVLHSPEDKAGLYHATGAAAADMESAAVARVAARHDAPFLSIRALADTATMTVSPVLTGMLDDFGRPHLPGLLPQLILQPGLIPELFRLARAFGAATRSLRIIARDAGDVLGSNRQAIRR